jgi:putative photosynthetic complex assembly protein 2
MHHEVALALTAVGVAALTLGAPNPVGGWTVLVLFAARLSSKFNLFLGAPSFSAALFPPHLRHMASYLRRGRVTALFPVSLLALGTAAAAAAAMALDPAAGAFLATAGALVATLCALAALEHVFMALPLADTALWRWALPPSDRPPAVRFRLPLSTKPAADVPN